MSFKTFLYVYAWLAVHLWMIWALVTPIFPTTYHWHSPGAPRGAGLLAIPARVSDARVVGLERALRDCFVFEADWLVGIWSPSAKEAIAADSAVSIFLADVTKSGGPPEMEAFFDSMRTDARQIIGIDRFVQGRGYLINGYRPSSADADRFLTKCSDRRWRWSIEYSPESGFHHFSAFRDTCEDPDIVLPD